MPASKRRSRWYGDPRATSRHAEIAYCRSAFNNSNGGQKVQHGRQNRVPKR